MSAPTLDTTSSGVNVSYASSASITLSTTHSNDIIVVVACTDSLGVSSISSTSGLAWQKRSSIAETTQQTYCFLDVWWALASSPLTNEAITVHYASNFDDFSGVAFSVSGCNTSSPWDSNPSLPVTDATYAAAGGDQPTLTYSTTKADDFVLMAIGEAATNGYNTPPSGFTYIQGASNGGGAHYSAVGAAYQRRTAAQSNASVQWGAAIGNYTGACWIVDALTADGAAPPPTSAKRPQQMIIM
jgi:hypothetical protein